MVDDRGPIGANGVHIYQIRVATPPYNDEVFEMPEDEIDVERDQDVTISNDAIVKYLQHGGLLQILRANLSGGTHQPRVWLSRDTLGNVVHTFVSGNIGGASVPLNALHNNHIFTPKLNEVVQFLAAFGLSDRDAKRVTQTVGTNP